MTALRSLAFNFLMLFWTGTIGLFGLPLVLLDSALANRLADWWARGVLGLARIICGIRYRIEGEANRREVAIYAAKHQSAWETIALWVILDRPVFVLKQELLSIPVFGPYLKRVPHIAIDRSAGSAAVKDMVAQAKTHVAAGKRIVIFPEGTRTKPGERVPYKNGIATLYRQLDIPVVPVALDSGVFWGRRAYTKRPGTITVALLEPLEPGIAKEEFMALLEERIETASAALLAA